jgi:putative ABC transport system permease protein
MAVPIVTIFEGVGIAFGALRANKVRASLTIMGVAIGVFVVVVLSSIVKGVNDSFARDLEAAGPTSFYVYRRPINMSGCDGTDETCPERRNPPLTIAEADAIERLSTIKAVTAHVGMSASFKYKDRADGAGMEVYTPNWTDVDGGDIYPGRSFTKIEHDGGAPVVILNERLAENLFGDSDPMGKSVNVNGASMQVIGIYHYTASPMGTPTSAGGGDSPKAIVPFETARRHLGLWRGGIDLIVKPHDGISVEEATDDVIALLRTRRGLKPMQDNNFAIVTQDRLMAIYDELFGTIFLVMLALSGVGLMVGGVGVVAIMMISVTERTREIGVRKALGATRATILWQFLVEAVTLTAVGALVGLGFGIAVANAVEMFAPVPIPVSTPLSTIAIALGMSAFTGILFGMLPAIRASRLDPVAALRHE